MQAFGNLFYVKLLIIYNLFQYLGYNTKLHLVLGNGKCSDTSSFLLLLGPLWTDIVVLVRNNDKNLSYIFI